MGGIKPQYPSKAARQKQPHEAIDPKKMNN